MAREKTLEDRNRTVLGLIALRVSSAALAWMGAAAAFATAAIGGYHTGVERGWWDGPTSCTSSSISGMSTDDLFNQIMAAPLIRCDEIPWDIFGISMANLNAVFSLGAALLWIYATRMKS